MNPNFRYLAQERRRVSESSRFGVQKFSNFDFFFGGGGGGGGSLGSRSLGVCGLQGSRNLRVEGFGSSRIWEFTESRSLRVLGVSGILEFRSFGSRALGFRVEALGWILG